MCRQWRKLGRNTSVIYFILFLFVVSPKSQLNGIIFYKKLYLSLYILFIRLMVDQDINYYDYNSLVIYIICSWNLS